MRMCEFWQKLIVVKPIGSELDARKEIYIIQIHCSWRGSISGHLVWLYIYPNNSHLFFAIPQIYVLKQPFTYVYFYEVLYVPMLNKQSPIRKSKFINKPFMTDLSVRPIET